MANRSETIRRDLTRWAPAEDETDLCPKLDGKLLTVTFDLTRPLAPQLEDAYAEAQWEQHRLGKLKREKGELSSAEFQTRLDVLKSKAKGKSFQAIGDKLHKVPSAAARKTWAVNAYRSILSRHRKPRTHLKFVRLR